MATTRVGYGTGQWSSSTPPGNVGASGSTGMDPFTQWAISAGLGTFLSWWQTRKADQAAGRQVDQSKEALALEQRMFEAEQEYQRQRDAEDTRRYENDRQDKERAYADLAPYRAIGRGALGKLGLGTGIDLPANFTNTSLSPQQALMDTTGQLRGPSLQGGSLSNLGNPAPPTPPPPGAQNFSMGNMVNIRTPTGQIVLVPFSQVNDALAHGGTRV